MALTLSGILRPAAPALSNHSPRPARCPDQLQRLARPCNLLATRSSPFAGSRRSLAPSLGRDRGVSAPSSVAVTSEAEAKKWWMSQKELWVEVEDEEHYWKLVHEAGQDGKLLIVDFYATWCSACQKVYPVLCLIAEDKKLRKQFVFAKLQIDKFKGLVKSEGISVLPTVRCYGPKSHRVFQATVTPRKVQKFRKNLETVLENSMLSYVEDDKGDLYPQAQETTAAESAFEDEEELKRVITNGTPPTETSKSTNGKAAPAKDTSPSDKASGQAPPSHSRWLKKAIFMVQNRDDYGYDGRIDDLYQQEIGNRLEPNEHYMDYCAAALYCNSMIDASMAELKSNVFGNPHSPAPSSVRTELKVEGVRERVLKYFNADPAEYQVVFTRGATASLKMVGETFPWSERSRFIYLRENHNSVLGQRAYALRHGASFQAVDEEWVNTWLEDNRPGMKEEDNGGDAAYNMFAFPAEDNFAGVKYPLEWVKGVQAKSTGSHKWKVLVDAAAYVHSQPLDLSAVPADFVSISFYKMFGYPTGVGALLIRTENVDLLDKVFWGGGSVALSTASDNFHVLKCKPSERLEDGTIAFLDIIALNHGFDMIEKLGGITRIEAHVSSLSNYLYKQLSGLRHSNGKPMVVVFGKHDHPNRRKVQGGIVNFEVLGADGSPFSYREFQEAAGRAGFHIRTGAECNPGACYKYLGIQEREIEGLAGEKEGCNDDVEYITVQRQADFHELGKSIDSKEILASISDTNVPLGHIGEIAMKWVKVPLGSIRVSLGYMSTFEDVQALVDWVASRYKDKTQQY